MSKQDFCYLCHTGREIIFTCREIQCYNDLVIQFVSSPELLSVTSVRGEHTPNLTKPTQIVFNTRTQTPHY
jgi:hypothetical protein